MAFSPLEDRTFFDLDVSPPERVFAALARAEDRVSRLDERVRGSGFVEGWSTRADLRAVLSAMAAGGHLVHPEDLILHDLGADVRIPDASVFQARNLLLARRKAVRGGPELLSWSGVAWMSGLTRQPPPPGERPSATAHRAPGGGGGLAALNVFFKVLAKGEADSGRGGVEECLAVLDLDPVPPLLMAAALMESWRVVDPLPHLRSIGGLAAAVVLKTSGRFASGLFPFEVALRRRPMPSRLMWGPIEERLAYWLALMEQAAELELDELTRLGHQKAQIERKAAGERRSSRAPDLARLAVLSPVLTTESISTALQITPQASLQLVRRMGGALQEITGRSRFRVWRL